MPLLRGMDVGRLKFACLGAKATIPSLLLICNPHISQIISSSDS
jgi:hypothetical protein